MEPLFKALCDLKKYKVSHGDLSIRNVLFTKNYLIFT